MNNDLERANFKCPADLVAYKPSGKQGWGGAEGGERGKEFRSEFLQLIGFEENLLKGPAD